MEKHNTYAQKFIDAAAKELFPENFSCLLCGVEIFEGRFCADCRKEIIFNSGATCPVCGRKTAKPEICIECKAKLPAYEKAVSPLVYGEGAAALITRFKNGKPFMAGWLAGQMASALKQLPAADCMVCVPMTPAARRRRGYNQSELLAERLGKLTGIPVLEGALSKVAETKHQKRLTAAERAINLAQCFKADKNLVKGKRILLVDDVLTTGATLNSVAECLKKAGACAVYCVTAASVTFITSALTDNE